LCVSVTVRGVVCVYVGAILAKKEHRGTLIKNNVFKRYLLLHIQFFFSLRVFFKARENEAVAHIWYSVDEHVISSPIFVSYVRKKKGVLFLFLRLLTLYEIRFTLKCIRPHREILCA